MNRTMYNKVPGLLSVVLGLAVWVGFVYLALVSLWSGETPGGIQLPW